MADPFSIIANVAGVLDFATKAALACNVLVNRYANAPLSLTSILAECRVLRMGLNHVYLFMKSNFDDMHSRLIPESLLTEDLQVALTGCSLTFALLDRELQRIMDISESSNSFTWTEKLRYAWNEDSMVSILGQMRGLESAVNLLLTALQTQTMAAVLKLLSTQAPVVDRVKADVASIRSSDAYEELVSRSNSFHSHRSSVASMMFDFEDELVKSRVYRKVRRAAKSDVHSSRVESGISRLSSSVEEPFISPSQHYKQTDGSSDEAQRSVPRPLETSTPADAVPTRHLQSSGLPEDSTSGVIEDKTTVKEVCIKQSYLPSIEITPILSAELSQFLNTAATPAITHTNNKFMDNSTVKTPRTRKPLRPVLKVVTTNLSPSGIDGFLLPKVESVASDTPSPQSLVTPQSSSSSKFSGKLTRSPAYRWKPQSSFSGRSELSGSTAISRAYQIAGSQMLESPEVFKFPPLAPQSPISPNSGPLDVYWNDNFHDPNYCWYRATLPGTLEIGSRSDVNMVMIGENGVGKSSAVSAFIYDRSPERQSKRVATDPMVINRSPLVAQLGQKLQTPSCSMRAVIYEYNGTHYLNNPEYPHPTENCAVVLCVNLHDRASLFRMKRYSWPSISRKFPNSPVFVMGLSRRGRTESSESAKSVSEYMIPRVSCESFARHSNAVSYMECPLMDVDTPREVISAILGYAAGMKLFKEPVSKGNRRRILNMENLRPALRKISISPISDQ